MATGSTPCPDGKKKSRSKREKQYTKQKLPFVNELEDETPIPPLSPVLCTHRFPLLELVSAEDHGLYWVSPQCDNYGTMPKSRQRKRNIQLITQERKPSRTTNNSQCEDLLYQCGQSQQTKTHIKSRKNAIIHTKKLSAKERFLSQTSKVRTDDFQNQILVPETPINQQGLTLKDKLLRRSKRLGGTRLSTPMEC